MCNYSPASMSSPFKGITWEFHKPTHSRSRCIRISASCCCRNTPAEPQVYMSENLASMTKTLQTIGRFGGLKGLFPHWKNVEWRCGRILWKYQLFSYLRCIYSMRMWQMYCRAGIKMSRWNCLGQSIIELSCTPLIWDLLPSTGCSVMFEWMTERNKMRLQKIYIDWTQLK